MFRFALPQLTSLQQIEKYVQRYPLPALPELDLLAEIAEVVSVVPEDAAEQIRRTVQSEFQQALARHLNFEQLVKVIESEIVSIVFDLAVRDIAYLSPGLLKQTEAQHDQLFEVISLLAHEGRPSGDQLLEAQQKLDRYFDAVELQGDIVVSHQDRQDFFSDLLAEAEETAADAMEAANDEMYEALQAAESIAEETLQEELDNLADEIAEDVQLELDPVAHMEQQKLPFYSWNSLVSWYGELVGPERALPTGPEFRTKPRSQGPRTVDVTHLQEDQQHAVQRRTSL